jgi:competence protein ComEC
MKPIKPLVYYSVALYLGCVIYVFSTESKFLGAVIAASFLMIILFTIEKRFFVIIMLFFIFGIVTSSVYYNYNQFSSLEKIKLVKMNSFYGVGRINGRNVIIKGEIKNLQIGDSILVYGKFENKKDYYEGIVGEFDVSKVQTKYKNLSSFFYSVKKQTYKRLSENLGEEKAALIMSLCYGDTESITDSQKYSFQRLGVIHAISVSGFHMAIIYRLIEGVCGVWISSAVSFLYLIFTGSAPATSRAFIMIIILKLSKKVFKNYDAISSLCFSSIIILSFKPFYALNLGFSLSYLATLGIILYYNKLKRALFKLPLRVNESFSLTMSAQVFSMPYAALTLGNISFGFIPGNLMLLPIYSALVIVGNIALLFLKIDFVFNSLCRVIYLITVVLDGAHFVLLKISPPVSYLTFIEAISLLILISSFILVKKGLNQFKRAPICVLIILLLQYYSFFPKLQFINIGSEEYVLITYKTESILIHDEDVNYSKNYSAVDKRFLARKVVSAEEGLTISLGNNHIIKIHTEAYTRNNTISAEIVAGNSTSLITRNITTVNDMKSRKYDIIKLPDIRPYGAQGRGRSIIDILSYKLIGEKVIAVSEIGS